MDGSLEQEVADEQAEVEGDGVEDGAPVFDNYEVVNSDGDESAVEEPTKAGAAHLVVERVLANAQSMVLAFKEQGAAMLERAQVHVPVAKRIGGTYALPGVGVMALLRVITRFLS